MIASNKYKSVRIWRYDNNQIISTQKTQMEQLSSSNIADIDIKKLNLLIKTSNMTEDEAKALKYSRRLKKMSHYNKAQREKKKRQELSLEAEREYLQQEYSYILQEVQMLKEAKLNYEVLQILDDLEDQY